MSPSSAPWCKMVEAVRGEAARGASLSSLTKRLRLVLASCDGVMVSVSSRKGRGAVREREGAAGEGGDEDEDEEDAPAATGAAGGGDNLNSS